MAEEKIGDNIPEMMVDYDTSNPLYQDNVDVASEVFVETYFHQQQRQTENSAHLCEVSVVQPLVYEGCAVPDYEEEDSAIAVLANAFQNALPGEQREILEVRSNPEDSGIFTTHSDKINSDEVAVTTNSPQNRTDSIIEEKISNKKNMAITKEMSLEQQNESDLTSIKIDIVRHKTEMMESRKPELTGDTDGNGNAVHTNSNDLLQSSDNANEESNSAHPMLTRSAAKAAKSSFHSTEDAKTPRKRKKSGVSSTSSSDAAMARSFRISPSAKKVSKKPRCSRTAYK